MMVTESDARPAVTGMLLMQEGWRLLRPTLERGPPLWLTFVLWELILNFLQYYVPEPSIASLVLLAADYLVTITLTGIGTRFLLGRLHSRQIIDSDFSRYIRASLGVALMVTPFCVVIGLLAFARMPAALELLTDLLLVVAIIVVGIGFSLWPIGQLMGDRACGPGDSWRRTRGATLPVVGVCLLIACALGLPLLLLLTVLPVIGPGDAGLRIGWTVIKSVAQGCSGVSGVALFAALYVLTSRPSGASSPLIETVSDPPHGPEEGP